MEEAQQILDDLLEEVNEYKNLNTSYLELISLAKSFKDISKSQFDKIDELTNKLSITNEKIESKADALINAIDNNHKDLDTINTSYLNIASTIQETYASNIDNFKSKLDSNNTRFNKSHKELQVTFKTLITNFQNEIDSSNKNLYKSIQSEVDKLTDLYKQELQQINSKIGSEIENKFKNLQSSLESTIKEQQHIHRKHLLVGFSILLVFTVVILVKLFL